jgi:hypothetical protein
MKIKFVLAMFGLALGLQAFAADVITIVGSVIESRRTNRMLVLSTVDGRVYKTDRSREMKAYLETLRGQTVTIQYNVVGTERLITSIYPTRAVSQDINFFVNNPNRSFAPTDVGSLEAATRIFNGLDDTNKTRSQCFKRAHMWSYDMWSRLGINSQKIFIFYTSRYIQLEDFDWWFHVAPVITAGGVDYALDRAFTKKPLTIREWKDKFLNKNITCPTIEHYDEYESNQWSRLCYLRKLPMWYFRPADIRDLDRKGTVKNGWDLMELQDSRRAFDGGEQTYEALDTGTRTVTH